jgi:hypothetical protein
MADNPLLNAINTAVRANETLGDFFGYLYTKDDPNTIIAAAYRNAMRAMTSALQDADRLPAVHDTLEVFKNTLADSIKAVLRSAQEAGIKNAADQLKGYGVKAANPGQLVLGLVDELNVAMKAITAEIASQQATIEAIALAELDTALITGTQDRTGILRPSPVAEAAAFWITNLFHDSFGFTVSNSGGVMGFRKQAIAALDRKTTDCCIRVHGQIQPFDTDFYLTGTPRFADRLAWSPFHGRCRTSIALYLAKFDDGLTDQMLQSAEILKAERAQGLYIDRGPANAFIKN